MKIRSRTVAEASDQKSGQRFKTTCYCTEFVGDAKATGPIARIIENRGLGGRRGFRVGS
jgi:hypothetical protein